MSIELISTILGIIVGLPATCAIIIKFFGKAIGLDKVSDKLDTFEKKNTETNEKIMNKIEKIDSDLGSLHSDFRILSSATKAQLRVEVRRIYYKGKQRGDQLKQYEADTLADIEEHYIALGDGDTEINVLLAQMKEWERVLN